MSDALYYSTSSEIKQNSFRNELDQLSPTLGYSISSRSRIVSWLYKST